MHLLKQQALFSHILCNMEPNVLFLFHHWSAQRLCRRRIKICIRQSPPSYNLVWGGGNEFVLEFLWVGNLKYMSMPLPHVVDTRSYKSYSTEMTYMCQVVTLRLPRAALYVWEPRAKSWNWLGDVHQGREFGKGMLIQWIKLAPRVSSICTNCDPQELTTT